MMDHEVSFEWVASSLKIKKVGHIPNPSVVFGNDQFTLIVYLLSIPYLLVYWLSVVLAER